MATIRFIGDVHGKFGRYKTLLVNSPHPTIQVGDMGVGFRRWPHGEWSVNPPFDVMVAGDHRFIRGNHDNPETCRNHKQCIADGSIIDNMMFVGGALSVDKALRYDGFSWWEGEELSPDALMAMADLSERTKPEIMVTHECPEQIAATIVGRLRNLRGGMMKMDPRFASRTRQAFDGMFGLHKPKLWLFGHWHVPFDETVDGTRFICLPELAYADVETTSCTIRACV